MFQAQSGASTKIISNPYYYTLVVVLYFEKLFLNTLIHNYCSPSILVMTIKEFEVN